MKRDSRVDPQPGDVLRFPRHKRTVQETIWRPTRVEVHYVAHYPNRSSVLFWTPLEDWRKQCREGCKQ